MLLFRQRSEVDAVKPHLAARDARIGRQHAHEGARQRGLAAPRFADEAECSARWHGEIDAFDGMHVHSVHAIGDGKILDLEKGAAHLQRGGARMVRSSAITRPSIWGRAAPHSRG